MTPLTLPHHTRGNRSKHCRINLLGRLVLDISTHLRKVTMRTLLIKLAFATSLAMIATATFAEVTITDPWVRGVVPGQSATGLFMTIKSTEAATLVGVSSPVAKSIEIHQMIMKGDMMTMRPMPSLPIPANGTVAFKPGGYHAMLNDLTKPLVKGEKVPVTLTFQGKDGKKTSTEIQAEVRDLAAPPMNMKME